MSFGKDVEDGWSYMREEVAILGNLVTSERRVRGVTSTMILGKVAVPDLHGCKPSWFLSTSRPFHL